MEKRRIRLEINGVVCGLITQESEEYMQSLAQEVGEMMAGVQNASPFITREAAALTAALGYCDDAKKNGQKAFALQERVDELEVEAELWQEEKAELAKGSPSGGGDPALREKLRRLEERNTALEETAGKAREQEGLVSQLRDENAALQERLKALEKENGALRKEADSAGGDGEPEDRIFRLEEDNQALRRELEEQTALARKAEQEKAGAVAAAKRAVEEAKKRVDLLQEEAERAREEAAQAQAKLRSPALDLLEREAAESGAERPEPPEERKPAGGKRRKNPLRHEDDLEQEGFVSFFEKL